MMTTDTMNRPIGDLRISVTDRCNFRCTYCMPLDEYKWAGRSELLTFEEIERLAVIFVDSFGVGKLRLTGGEPLVRRNLNELVERLVDLGKTRWMRWAWNAKVQPAEIKVALLYLAYKANAEGVTPQLSMEDLSTRTKIPVEMIPKTLARLQELGLVKVLQTYRFAWDIGMESATFQVAPITAGLPHLMRHSFGPENTSLAIWSV